MALSATSARADVPAADAKRAADLFEQGRKLIAAKQTDAACDAFAQSYALDPQSGTRLNLAACRVQQDRLTEAHALFEQALAEAESTFKTVKANFARDQLRAIEARLVRLRFALPAIAGAVVTLNGQEIDPTRPLLVRPGKLVIDVTAPDHQPYHLERLAVGGADLTIDVPALAPGGPAAGAPPASTTPPAAGAPLKLDDAPPRRRGPLPYVLGATGGALLITAGVLTLHARARWTDAIDARDEAGVSSAQREADLATGVSIAGGIALGVGVVLWLRGGRAADPDRVSVRVSPTGVGIAGRF